MNWLGLAILGGLVGIDSTSFAQVMISRPLVAATLTGILFGRPAEGAMLGLLLEAFTLVTLPIGAARYPEAGTAAVAGTAAYLSVVPAGPHYALLLAATAFALAYELVTGESVNLARRASERLASRPLPVGGAAAAVERRHLAAIGLDLARAVLVSLLGAAIGAAILAWIGPGLPTGIAVTRVAIGALVIAGSAMVGALLPLFGGLSGARLPFLLGLVWGTLLLLLTR